MTKAKFTEPDLFTKELLTEVITKYHEELGAVGVSISILMVHPAENDKGEKVSAALKLRGHPCDGISSITPIKYRAMGVSDAHIQLAADRWDEFTDKEKVALLDHELEHFIVSRNQKGDPIIDSMGRPKLKMKIHDVELGFFTSVAMRHKMDSGEVHACRQLLVVHGETYFPFIAPESLAALAPKQEQKQLDKKPSKKGKK